MTPHEDKIDVITYWLEGMANFNVIMIMMIVSVEQRPGWGEHVSKGIHRHCICFFNPKIILKEADSTPFFEKSRIT